MEVKISVRGNQRGSLSQEHHLDQRSPGCGKTGIEKNPEKGAGREKRNGRNLVSDPMTGHGTVTEMTSITEIVIGPETGGRGKDIVAVTAIVTVIVRVVVIEVETVVVNMIGKGIASIVTVLEIGTEKGTGITKLGKQNMTVGVLVIKITTMITWKASMTARGMVKGNGVMIKMELKMIVGGMRLSMATNVLRLSMMTRVMTITDVKTGGSMMMMLVVVTVIIITLLNMTSMSLWKMINKCKYDGEWRHLKRWSGASV